MSSKKCVYHPHLLCLMHTKPLPHPVMASPGWHSPGTGNRVYHAHKWHSLQYNNNNSLEYSYLDLELAQIWTSLVEGPFL